MKNALALLALAASLSEVAATGFHKQPPFKCPDNTDNKCDDKQKGGFNWGDLKPGKFDFYNGFNFNGWTCEDSFSKRDESVALSERTFGGKVISGKCGSNKNDSPKLGCGSGGPDKFSIKHFDVTVEFDCDLEFHYDMPDGSKCKHRSRCSKAGTTVKNSQCGGAKNVTIVYPPQPQKPKECHVGVHKIDFDCEPPKPPVPPKNPPKTKTTKSTTSTTSTRSVSTPAPPPPAPTTTSTTSTTVPPVDVPTTTSTTTPPVDVPTTTSTATTPGDDEDTTTSSPPVSSPPPVTTVVTSFFSTSTIFTTRVETVTSCPPTVPNCPNGGVTIVTATVPLTTTICPVTETVTRTASTVAPPPPVDTKPPTEPEEPSSSVSSALPVPEPSSTKPALPVTTLPCPDVVPKCLNTWLFTVGCSDNTDTTCFCPDKLFVENVFTCLYAHGETDTIVSEAIFYFQGICGPQAPGNPAIVTGADTITKVITVTAPPVVPAPITTIVVATTVVVPCETDGVIIPGSSTTTVISTVLTVPEVDFHTGDDVVPVPAAPTNQPAVPGQPTTFATAQPTAPAPIGGTGSLPSTTGSRPPIPTAGAAKVGSMGLGLAVLVAAVAAF